MEAPITVVMPVFNRAGIVRRTLDSVASQVMKPAKIVLVDNNSTDATLEVLTRWAQEHPELNTVIVSETKKSASCARNRGLQEVDTEFVMFFDSDDVMLPNHIRDFAEAINREPEVDIWGRSVVIEMLDGSQRILYFTDKAPLFNNVFRGSMSTQRYIARTSLVRSVGGWDESLKAWDDFELGVRLLLATDKVREVPGKITVRVFRTEESLTGMSYSARSERWEEAIDTIEKHFRHRGLKHWIRMADARRMILAAQYMREALTEKDDAKRRKAEEEAGRLRAQVLARTDSPRRMRLLYWHNVKFKRLTWILAGILFPH